MLAQNFKSAMDLKITEAEQDALIQVLGMLERGELTQASKADGCGLIGEYEPTSSHSFHMAITTERHDCGTVACIGGWAATFLGVDGQDYVNHRHSPALMPLYWPRSDMMDSITPEIAAIALRSFLTTGEPNWLEAFAV